jgi:hypothetical protein
MITNVLNMIDLGPLALVAPVSMGMRVALVVKDLAASISHSSHKVVVSVSIKEV